MSKEEPDGKVKTVIHFQGTIPAGADGTVCESGFGLCGPFRAYECSRCVPYIDEFWKWCGGECENTEVYFECFMDDEHPGWRSK